MISAAVWARATAPHAGPDRDFMFLPEIGDEVAVAFEDGDQWVLLSSLPEELTLMRPILPGSLWSTTRAGTMPFHERKVGSSALRY